MTPGKLILKKCAPEMALHGKCLRWWSHQVRINGLYIIEGVQWKFCGTKGVLTCSENVANRRR